MIIGVCGYGATGSSAVVGLLKEYPELIVCDKAEIQEAFRVDGLQDLEYHLLKKYARHISGDAAIHRFKQYIKYYDTPIVKKTIPREQYKKIASEYIESLIQGEWYGVDNIDYNTGHPLYNFIVLLYKKIVFPKYEKITGHSFNHWPARKMYLSIEPDNFYEKTIHYTDELIKAVGGDSTKKVVFDQVFEGNAPQNCFPFFRDPKAIVVDRDPRDLYLITKYAELSFGEARFMPRKDVKTFVTYYRKLRQHQNRVNTSNIILIRFEDLIYRYDETVKKIEKFVGCTEHINTKKYFKPEVSMHNTQLFNNPEYFASLDEVRYIEEQLPEYLYDFNNFPKLCKFNKPF